ncbi:MAG: nickel pincer cofactor biosynthesis protein LarC [Planctomycetota bacterium]|nr:MAG: nickel pincer cofactor biosynthesis protein LarC [Planctomycetota bacterium]
MPTILYFDCLSGISGDMTLGALVDLGVPLELLNERIGSLGLPECRLEAAETKKRGFRATQVRVVAAEEHAHRHLSHILKMIDGSTLTDRERDLAERIFRRLAEAEAKVHGTTVEKVHFHEVGAADSIADIVGAAVGLTFLSPARVAASAVPTGTGTIRIAHGTCSVPAPAVAELLCGIPVAASDIPMELTTPTGAAILATVAESFGPLPAMTIERIGYGAGERDIESQPNVLRCFWGTVSDDALRPVTDRIWIVETNLDDASGEMIGYCAAKLWEVGALDVYTVGIQMKKNRPAVTLTVLCREEDLARVETTIFRETTTLGVRRMPVERHTLPRRAFEVETPWGTVSGKVARLPDGTLRFAPEFESCRAVAESAGVSLGQVYEQARSAFRPEQLAADDPAGWSR